MKKLAIFDFDGTLFDSVCDVVISFNKALEIHNFPTLTREEYLGCLGGNIDEITALVLGENMSDENLKAVKATYLDIYNPSKKENTLPFPDAHDVLKELQEKGVLLAINSNRLTYSLNEFVERFFDDIDFVEIEGHNQSNPSKPHPYGVRKIIKKANVDNSEVIYIGDSITDIKTSQNAGVDCLLVSWGYGSKNDMENDYPIGVVEDMHQIINYF